MNPKAVGHNEGLGFRVSGFIWGFGVRGLGFKGVHRAYSLDLALWEFGTSSRLFG